MRYFQYFPTLTYRTTEIQNGLPQEIVRSVPNMTVRLQSIAELGAYEWYQIQDRDRADTLAAQWYGSSKYAWVVMLSNNMRDLYDWPMTNLEFYDYMNKKYLNYVVSSVSIADGGQNYQIDDVVIVNGATAIQAILKVTTVAVGGVATSVEILDRGSYAPDNLPVIENNTATTFTGNGTGLKVNLTLIDKIPATQLMVHQYLWNNSDTGQQLVVDATLYATLDFNNRSQISVYDYENSLNDKRRDIKRLLPDTFQSFLRQFEQLMGSLNVS